MHLGWNSQVDPSYLNKRELNLLRNAFAIIFSWKERGYSYSFDKIWMSFTQGCFEFWSRIRNIFQCHQCTFAILQLFPLWVAKDDHCRVWLKLADWFWKRRLLNVVNTFLLFRYYHPFKQGVILRLNKLESFTQACYMPSLDEMSSAFKEVFLNVIRVLLLHLQLPFILTNL